MTQGHARRGMGAEDYCVCDQPWPCRACPECEGTGVVSNCGVTVNCDGSHTQCDSRECPECDGEGQR